MAGESEIPDQDYEGKMRFQAGLVGQLESAGITFQIYLDEGGAELYGKIWESGMRGDNLKAQVINHLRLHGAFSH